MTGDSDRWISYNQAAELIGCHQETVVRWVRAGEIAQRQVRRSLPSLHLESLEAFAERWQERESQRAQLREERERRLLERPILAEPPELDADDVWLDSATVAMVLRLSMTRVQQLAGADRLPHVWAGRQRWFRRSHIEQIAAARALRSLARARTPEG